MRHLVRKKQFGRHTSHRVAMFRNMVTSLIEEGRITTTVVKAKELRRIAEKMVTLAKQGTLHARRRAARYVRTAKAVQKLFAEIGPSFLNRQGGYTRVLKLGFRHGDGSDMALIEYVGFAPMLVAKKKEEKGEKPKEEKKEQKATPAKNAKASKKKKAS